MWTGGGPVSQVGVLGELHSSVPDHLGDFLKFIRLLRATVFSAIQVLAKTTESTLGVVAARNLEGSIEKQVLILL